MKPPPAGYSGTPLPKKLGLKPGMRLHTLGAPADLPALLAGAPANLVRLERPAPFDCALVFVTSLRDWRDALATLEGDLAQDGMIWAAWPKKSSTVATDLSEAVVRESGLAAGLVDVKVCAIDATWSGLKFVRRLRDRRQ
jgi:hypothetical protein